MFLLAFHSFLKELRDKYAMKVPGMDDLEFCLSSNQFCLASTWSLQYVTHYKFRLF